jgi:hypothetical protein
MRLVTLVFGAPTWILLAAPCACTAAGTSLPSRCEAIEIDPMRELVVTDAAIVGDARVGFARVMGTVLGATRAQAASAWVNAWTAMPGEAAIATDVQAPWADSGTSGPDLARAPFELIAIVNRVDFSTVPGRMGELRFVYGLVTSGKRRPLTVNVELRLPPNRSAQEWAQSWHALGSLTGDANREALMAIVDAVLQETLTGQLRTQDAGNGLGILLEFDVNGGDPLVPSPLFNQPASTVSAPALAAFVAAQQSEVLAGDEIVPVGMLARYAAALAPEMNLPGVPANVVAAFVTTTCTGCHTSGETIDGTFQISPLRRGQAALSPFLLRSNAAQPGAGAASKVPSSDEADELSRRSEVMRALLCEGGP